MNYKLLKNRSFFLLMQGSFVSQIGSMMQTFALSLYVLNHYDSATLFASILIVSIIPRLIIGPFAGVLVDWFDRKKIIVRFDMISGVAVGMMALLYYQHGELPLWSIYAISMVLSLISTLFQPAVQTVIPTIMKKEDLVDANAINSVIFTIGNLISPLLAGALMSFSVIGVVLIVNAISFFISAFTEIFIEMPSKHKIPEKISIAVFRDDFFVGLAFIKKSKFVLMIGIVACCLNFAISPVFSVAIPYILKIIIEVKDFEFGILNGVVATASIASGIFAPRITKLLSVNKILLIDFIAQPIIVGIITVVTSGVVLSLTDGYLLPLVLLGILEFILVLVMTLGNIVIGTTFQKEIPNELLGRVGTVIGTFAMGAIPLGQGIYGIMLEKFQPWVPMLCSAILLLIVVVKIYPVLSNTDYSDSNDADLELEENV
ncbi:MAG: MFS transporter [Clostridiales bacterium]|nr:MFS transporter [Clostridiales bacterium]